MTETNTPTQPKKNAIRVKKLTKTYRIYSSSVDRALAPFRKKDNARKFTALKNVDIDFPEGEVVAILGRNGSGKSTLLKMITGVTTPTSGEIEVNGRISAMLELTSGFDPELTGIENIYLRALALGIPKEEADRRKDEIIKFADIGDHINQPVRTYSSGMKARLGFAVSVSVDPDILIVDEVLAVGDDIFKLKCIEKMEEFRQQGKTILFVSHSLFTVKAFCTMGVWINKGEVMEYGELGPVVLKYEEFLKRERAKQREKERESAGGEDVAMEKKDILQVTGFRMFDDSGEQTTAFSYGEDIHFEFTYEVKKPIERLSFCYTVRNAEKLEVYMSDKQNARNRINSQVGKHTLRVKLKKPNLLQGEYLLSGELWNMDSTFYVGHSNKRPFSIIQSEYLGTGITHIDYEFDND
ncbi:MAG TPA: ABC transporter ATP-binding protein [Coriobacteriia bacterium]|nr:ABC transporter ATP-binding protein [Coriobacteriia bacterium]